MRMPTHYVPLVLSQKLSPFATFHCVPNACNPAGESYPEYRKKQRADGKGQEEAASSGPVGATLAAGRMPSKSCNWRNVETQVRPIKVVMRPSLITQCRIGLMHGSRQGAARCRAAAGPEAPAQGRAVPAGGQDRGRGVLLPPHQ